MTIGNINILKNLSKVNWPFNRIPYINVVTNNSKANTKGMVKNKMKSIGKIDCNTRVNTNSV